VPRRAIAAAAATAGGLALLFSFKTPSRTAPRGLVATGQPGTTDPASGGTSVSSGSAGSSPSSGSSGSTSSGAYKDGTVSGADEQTQFGDLQVQVTVKGGRITDVTELAAPYDRPRSQDINSYAGPILRQEALTAQSAQIDTVSGATISSDAYVQSLQAALDQLR
jgi:uncharacterized protein with FMN-binding domain